MRRTALACLASAALAAGLLSSTSSATGLGPTDGCLVVKDGLGKVALTLSGVAFGRLDGGSITVNDTGGTGILPLRVYGLANVKRPKPRLVVYEGENLRFKASGDFRVVINATGIDLSAAGSGSATLSSTGFDFAGQFSVDAESFCDASFAPMPDQPTQFRIGTVDQ